MKVHLLSQEGATPRELLAAVARERGCVDQGEVEKFLEPHPELPNPISEIPDYSKARVRLARALASNERIVLFGDYDCDGVCAVAQMHDFLRAVGAADLHWFIPERMADDYGLNAASVEKCFNKFKPSLVVSLDCGSSSLDPIRWLTARGVDTIVLDHHQFVGATEGGHPAVAHLNPKAWAPEPGSAMAQLAEMSAGGLTYLLVSQLAQDMECPTWPQHKSLMLAGLSTVADVMPMRGLNRALVKNAMLVANDVEHQGVPGLAALSEVCKVETVTAQTFGFLWGPRLNATGRLESATAALELLLSTDWTAAKQLAQSCDEWNRERQGIQRAIEKQADQAARETLEAEPGTKIIVLANKAWHCGVVGIVASHIKERFQRPAILCGWHDDGYWKGSGRSMEPYDLGHHVVSAQAAGLLLKGGGHKLAAGLGVSEDGIEAFSNWMNQGCPCGLHDFHPSFEVLAKVDGSRTPNPDELARKWHELLERLEPTGSGNPMPNLLLEHAKLAWGPQPKQRKESEEVWGYGAGFEWSGRGLIFLTWADPARAASVWRKGSTYSMVVNISKYSRPNGPGYSWRVIACEEESP